MSDPRAAEHSLAHPDLHAADHLRALLRLNRGPHLEEHHEYRVFRLVEAAKVLQRESAGADQPGQQQVRVPVRVHGQRLKARADRLDRSRVSDHDVIIALLLRRQSLGARRHRKDRNHQGSSQSTGTVLSGL